MLRYGYYLCSLFAIICSADVDAASIDIFVSKTDLIDTPDVAFRDPITMNLSAFGDYNGDGKIDKVYFTRNRERSKIYLILCIFNNKRICRKEILLEEKYSKLNDLYVRTVRPKDFFRESRQTKIRSRFDSIDLTYSEVGGTIYFFENGKFTHLPTGD